jgi:hypothetical protein
LAHRTLYKRINDIQGNVMDTKNRISHTLSAFIRPPALAACVGLLLSAPCASWAGVPDDDDEDDQQAINAAGLANMRAMMQMMNNNQAVMDSVRSGLARQRADQAERIAAYQQQRAAAQAIQAAPNNSAAGGGDCLGGPVTAPTCELVH